MDTTLLIVGALRIAAAQYGEDSAKCKAEAPFIAEQFTRQRRAALALVDLIEANGLDAVPARIDD
jgi:hypothetical protein